MPPKRKAKDAVNGNNLSPKKKLRGKKAKVEEPKEELPPLILKSSKKKEQEIKKEINDNEAVMARVDSECSIAKSCKVYTDSDVWDCMLNQTNIEFNNNKFYLIQLLKENNKNIYYIWMRWGRIGFAGQTTLKSCGSNLEEAKRIFKQKFQDKTRNDWHERDSFEKVKGKYDLIAVDHAPIEDTVDSCHNPVKDEVKEEIECKLEPRVKALIDLICDIKAMESSVEEMLYDSKKAPLGKLTEKQVLAGYSALKEINDLISGSFARSSLVQACNAYYTRIPHAFKMSVPPVLSTKKQILNEMNLLNTLADIQAAMSAMENAADKTIHPSDQHYNGLDCKIEPVERNSDEFKLLEKYLKTTHGKTHSLYTLEVENIFKINKKTIKIKDHSNKMLLWHGSRQTNMAGILSKGLRIAPPEAPSTGYMFGKGIYFADMASKSANYCMASKSNPHGILVLSEVSLGKCNELYQADYDGNQLPKGCHSVKGVGQNVPNPKNLTILNGVQVPVGPAIHAKAKNKSYALQYNEFIVYDPSQVNMKYLLQIKFNFVF